MFDVVRGRSSAPTRLRPALLVSIAAHAVLFAVALYLSRPVPPPTMPTIPIRLPPGLLHPAAGTTGTPAAQGYQPPPRRPAEAHPLPRHLRPTASSPRTEELAKDLPGASSEMENEGPEDVARGPECATPPCGGSGGVLTEDVVAEMPLLLSGPEVALPAEARRAGVEGTMLVRCPITAAGTVEACEVLKGLPLADAAVLAALRARQYRPAQVEGRAVSVRDLFTVRIERGH